MAEPPIHPNIITSMRLPMAPIAAACLVSDTLWGVVAAAVLALILELTDIADGYVARKYNVVSDFGKLFDPFADAFCRYTLFLALFAVGAADLWMVIVIFYRDASISFFRSVAGLQNEVIGARPSGKLKAIVQGVGTQIIFLSLAVGKIDPTLAPTEDIAYWTMFFVTLVTMASFVDYAYGSAHILKHAWYERLEE